MIDKNRLFDRVRSVTDVTREEFEEDLACAERELVSLFGRKYVYEDANGSVYEEYEPALSSEILFFNRGEEDDRARFLDRAEYAFRTVWKIKALEAIGKGEKHDSDS